MIYFLYLILVLFLWRNRNIFFFFFISVLLNYIEIFQHAILYRKKVVVSKLNYVNVIQLKI